MSILITVPMQLLGNRHSHAISSCLDEVRSLEYSTRCPGSKLVSPQEKYLATEASDRV